MLDVCISVVISFDYFKQWILNWIINTFSCSVVSGSVFKVVMMPEIYFLSCLERSQRPLRAGTYSIYARWSTNTPKNVPVGNVYVTQKRLLRLALFVGRAVSTTTKLHRSLTGLSGELLKSERLLVGIENVFANCNTNGRTVGLFYHLESTNSGYDDSCLFFATQITWLEDYFPIDPKTGHKTMTKLWRLTITDSGICLDE